MFLSKTYAIGTSVVWCALLAFAPQARAQNIGERGASDNSSQIIAICECVNSAEAASSQNCKALLASQNPENKQAPSGSNAIHSMMTPQSR